MKAYKIPWIDPRISLRAVVKGPPAITNSQDFYTMADEQSTLFSKKRVTLQSRYVKKCPLLHKKSYSHNKKVSLF